MRRAVLLAAVMLAAAPAQAGSTWQSDEDADIEARTDDYEKAMSDGDKAAMLAASESSSVTRMKKLILAAVREYELAAAARPDLAEPHWRAANTLYGFFFDCEGGLLCQADKMDPATTRRLIKHWDAVEAIDPMDPRLGAHTLDPGPLFHRALLRTKLATDADLEASLADYQNWLARSEADDPNRGLVLGNLAEGYMMVGQIENAIPTYIEALEYIQGPSMYYGLAVAYDRDGQGAKAREIIKALGETQFQSWYDDVAAGKTFYVPEGEVHYYLGLAYEALGESKEAVKSYRRFIKSGAHPQYQERAKENIDKLSDKKK
jgi:tetratricopeptide (TPR) repeat protein